MSAAILAVALRQKWQYMQLRINPERLAIVLLGVTGLLALGHLITTYLIFQEVLGDTINEVYRLFNMNHEVSIPTWFSQVLLLTAGVVALMVGGVRRAQQAPYALHWIAVAAILCFMSLDEGSSVHEIGSIVLQPALQAHGTWLHYTWVIASGALVVIVALVFARFWWKLPSFTRILVFAAAAVYIIGAIGFEMIGGYVAQNISTGMKLTLVHSLEESFEMMGAIIAIYAFLTYLRALSPLNSMQISEKNTVTLVEPAR